MYEYKCKIVKIVDGDTVDIDLDLGLAFGLEMRESELWALTLLKVEHPTKSKKYLV